MDNALIIAIIAAGGAIFGSTITCIVNYLSSKTMADREDRRRRAELEMKTAEERINKLYRSLLKIMTPNSPDDGIYFDRETCVWILRHIEENEPLASPELMHKYYEFDYYFHIEPEKIGKGLDREFFNLVDSEYNELKNILGYGSILRRPSRVSVLFNRLLLPFKKLKKTINEYISDKLRMWRINRRRKKSLLNKVS